MQPIRIVYDDKNGTQTFGPIKTMRDLEIVLKIDIAKVVTESDSQVRCFTIYEGEKKLISVSINCRVPTDYLLELGKAIYLTGSNEEKF